jgi:hypothetical protein
VTNVNKSSSLIDSNANAPIRGSDNAPNKIILPTERMSAPRTSFNSRSVVKGQLLTHVKNSRGAFKREAALRSTAASETFRTEIANNTMAH